MATLATIVTPGYIGNALVLWLLRQENLRFALLEAKPRERAKMEAMRQFLASGDEWWLLVNHYAAPQFELADVPFDRPVFAASMRRPVGTNLERLGGKDLGEQGDFIRTDFVPNGCLFIRRDAVEAVAEDRPFEFVHDQHGNCLKADDATLSAKLIAKGYDLWIWNRRCLNRQECFI